MEEHCSLPRFFPLSLLQISPFYILPSIQAVNLLSWGSRAVFFSLSILLVLRKYAVKRADYYMALQAPSLSLDLSISLTLSPSFLLYFPVSLSLSLCLSFNPLISSADEDWWRNFFLHHDVLSLLLCLTKRLITVLPLMLKVLFVWMKD